MKIFKCGNGESIELSASDAKIVAVQNTQWSHRHCYSITIGDWFVASKNYTRKTWRGFDAANIALEKLISLDRVNVRRNLLDHYGLKTVEQGWVYTMPSEDLHTIDYYYRI